MSMWYCANHGRSGPVACCAEAAREGPTAEQLEALIAAGTDPVPYVQTYTTGSSESPRSPFVAEDWDGASPLVNAPGMLAEIRRLEAELTRLRAIEGAALSCITASGHVILARCKPLADLLYTETA